MKNIKIALLLLTLIMVFASCKGNTRRHARVYKLKNHHIVMHDDVGNWYEYVVNNSPVNSDVLTSSTGRIQLPTGGSWRAATQQEEEEATVENEAVAEDATVSEGEGGAVDGDGGVGDADGGGSGDSGGGDSGGGDGGGDGGE